ncbi:MAG: hypothetical protein WDM90_18525 [Ferruginibacter sp.]
MAAEDAVATSLAVGINEFIGNNTSTLTASTTDYDIYNSAALFTDYNWSLVKDKYPNKLLLQLMLSLLLYNQ